MQVLPERARLVAVVLLLGAMVTSLIAIPAPLVDVIPAARVASLLEMCAVGAIALALNMAFLRWARAGRRWWLLVLLIPVMFSMLATLFVEAPWLVGIDGALALGVGLVIVAVVALRLSPRGPLPYQPGHCAGCGYDLTGNVSGRCPECGHAVHEQAPTA